jgi:transcriptional regulator with XRE-family HTH domain
MTNYNAVFGKALRNLRKSAGKTQETLAFDAELDRTYISMLELGQCSPTLVTLFALCNALDISLIELAIEIERCLYQEKQQKE